MTIANIEFWGNTKVNSQYLDWDKLAKVLPNGVLFINGSQLPPEGFTESEIADLDKVAESKPIILENCKANIISQLTYITQDVELACVRVLPDGCKVSEVLKYADGQEPLVTFSKGEAPQTPTDQTSVDPIELEKLIKQLEADPEYQKHKQEIEEDQKLGKRESEIDAAEVEKIAQSEPSLVVPKNQNDYYERLQVFESKSLESMSRSGNRSAIVIPSEMPRRAWYTERVNIGNGVVYWKPDPASFQEASMDLYLNVGLYALNNPQQEGKYLVVTLMGGGITPSENNRLVANGNSDRRWIQVGLDIEYGFKERQNNVRRENNAPQNANDETQLQSTTGWSLSVGASVSQDGPSASIGYEYSSQKTEITNVKDFDVRDLTNSERGKWEFRLNGMKDCNFGQKEHLLPDDGDYRVQVAVDCFKNGYRPVPLPSNLLSNPMLLHDWANSWLTRSSLLYWTRWWGDIKEIPDLGRLLLVPRSQVVWRADLSFNGRVQLYYKATHRLAGLTRPGSSYGRCSIARCNHRAQIEAKTFSVDFSKVSI
jgi:hypothetical protein